jgi:DNA-binding NarL/FixJ family response regulator
MGSSVINILIVDDQRLFADSLKRLLEIESSDIQIVAVAYDAQSALGFLNEFTPDIVLLDVRMPGTDGVELAKLIQISWPEVHVVMLTTFDDDEYVLEALGYGAVGYLLKDIPPSELIAAIHAIKEGGVMVSPSIVKKLIKPKQTTSDNEVKILHDQLSPKEKELLKLLTLGYNNNEIAEKLFLGPQTVRNYVSSIYDKLDVHNRAEAMRFGKQILSGNL